MKYIIISFCIALIVLAVLILINHIRSCLKGNCCQNCSGCKSNANGKCKIKK